MSLYRIVSVSPVLNVEDHAYGVAKWRCPRSGGWAQAPYGSMIDSAHHDIAALRAAGVVLEEVKPEPQPEPAPVAASLSEEESP